MNIYFFTRLPIQITQNGSACLAFVYRCLFRYSWNRVMLYQSLCWLCVYLLCVHVVALHWRNKMKRKIRHHKWKHIVSRLRLNNIRRECFAILLTYWIGKWSIWTITLFIHPMPISVCTWWCNAVMSIHLLQHWNAMREKKRQQIIENWRHDYMLQRAYFWQIL